MRRSVIASKDLKAGSKISIADLDVKRPGTGIPPEKVINPYFGNKMLTCGEVKQVIE